jgi:hypothetical protein
MTTTLAHSIIALLVVIVAALLLRPRYESAGAEAESSEGYAKGLWDGPGWNLAERIFDSSDYLWLRNELGSPQLARTLARSRRQMALKWLRAVRRSFDELVRTPEPAPPGGAPSDARGSGELLRLTLRFHLILGYAFLVVRFFGPYHRLVPSFGWMHPLFSRPERYGPADITRFP